MWARLEDAISRILPRMVQRTENQTPLVSSSERGYIPNKAFVRGTSDGVIFLTREECVQEYRLQEKTERVTLRPFVGEPPARLVRLGMHTYN